MIGNIHQRLPLLFAAAVLLACDPKPVSNSVVESDAVGRRVLNLPQPYRPQWNGEAVSDSLQSSMASTRQLAWRVFAEVAAPVPFVTQTKDGRTLQGAVPRFLTWLTVEDAQRWFRYALRQSPLSQVQSGEPLSDAQAQAADYFLAHELDTMPEPLQNRLKLWLDQHPEPTLQEWSGLGGASRIYFSPSLMHAILQNYAELGDCFQGWQRPSALGESTPCFQTEWPRSAAIVKAAWWNAKAKFKSFATDAASLARLMNTAESSWAQLAQVTETPDSIFSVRVGQESLLLPGFHIMTKDQKDWLWITAWWSADADSDFGADRPAFVKALGPLFDHYKICAVTRFQDDANDWDELSRKYPDLGAAFRAAQSGNPGSSWCSNPYLEAGVDNQRSNCIGCHQFAGTDARQDAILHDATQFPQHGSVQQRDSFVTDYVWSAALGGQSLFQLIASNLTWRKTLPVE